MMLALLLLMTPMVNTLLVELVIWEMVNVAVHGDSIDNGEVIMSMLVAPTLAAVMVIPN